MAQLKVSKQTPQRAKRRSTVSPLLWELAQGDPVVALKTMEASIEGLTDADVDRRRRIYGKNEVAHEKPPPWWVQFLKAFSSPFILVLLILAIVSYITDVYLAREPHAVDWKKVIILATMILVSGILRLSQEFRSVRVADRLKAMVRTMATVSRVRTTCRLPCTVHCQAVVVDKRSRSQSLYRVISFTYLPVTWSPLTYA